MASTVSQALLHALTLPIRTAKIVATEPLLTGALLWILTRGPQHIREKLLQPLRKTVLAKDSAARLRTIIRVLRFLLAYGVAKRVNQALNELALRDWHLTSSGPPWKFGDAAKSELVVVTGGSSGFGYEMVKGFANQARVVVIDINDLPSELAKLPEVYFYKCDLSDLNGIVSCTSAIKNRHGNPTVLVNNAGIANGINNSLLDTEVESLDRIFKVNIMSHFILIREFLPGMLEARKGHVVTLASVASFTGHPGLVDYCCTKAAAMSLHEGLRNEILTKHYGAHRIRTSIIHPHWHDTGIVRPYKDSLEAAGVHPDPPSNVADAVINQVLGDRSGQLVIPESYSGTKNARFVPLWIRDVVSGQVIKRSDRVEM